MAINQHIPQADRKFLTQNCGYDLNHQRQPGAHLASRGSVYCDQKNQVLCNLDRELLATGKFSEGWEKVIRPVLSGCLGRA